MDIITISTIASNSKQYLSPISKHIVFKKLMISGSKIKLLSILYKKNCDTSFYRHSGLHAVVTFNGTIQLKGAVQLKIKSIRDNGLGKFSSPQQVAGDSNEINFTCLVSAS